MADTKFDIVVGGGGPGGYVAAIRAAQLGLATAVVESQHLGGICLNWGCIPTKALLRSAEVGHMLTELGDYGFSADNVSFDLAKIVKRSRRVSRRLSGGVAHLLKKNKVTVIDGHGRLAGPGKLTVTKDDKPVATLEAKHIILATGARARSLPGLEPDGELIWTYKEAMVPETMPESLLVVGSGAIGIEFASFYRALGAEVTVVEVLDRVLPVEDAEISALAQKAFAKQGMTIHTGATVKALDKKGGAVTATIAQGDGKSEKQTFDRVILAIGITGNVEDIGGPTRPATKACSASRRSPASTACTPSTPATFPAAPIAARRWPVSASPKPLPRRPAMRSRSGASPSSPTARPSRSASPTASSRPCSTPRPASCSART